MTGPHLAAKGGIAAVASALVDGVPAVSPDVKVSYLPLTVRRSHSLVAKVRTALAAYVRLGVHLMGRTSIVHVHVSHGSDFWRATPLVLLAKLWRARVVLHVHPPRAFSGFVRQGPSPLSSLKRRIVGLADAIVATCPSGSDDLSELFPSSRIEVVENMIDFSAYRSAALSQRRVQAVFLGWLIPEKGVFDLLEAFAEVASTSDGARLAMYGPYGRDAVQRAVDRLGLGQVVTVGEWIAGEEKAELLASSRAFVLPSYTEGMPVVIAECMASGLPVVTTPVGGIPDVVVDGENGLHVPPGDVEQLATAIETLLSDDDVWQRMSGECLRSAGRFDSVAACRRMVDIYRDLVGVS